MNSTNEGTNIGPYEERVKDFSWDAVSRELGHEDGAPLNIGWYCTDRICKQGLGGKTALIWESTQGEERKYTFDQMRLYSNAYAKLLQELGVKDGERVAIYLDRVPSLYFSLLGILKLGAIAVPMFSAFGEEALQVRLANCDAVACITSPRLARHRCGCR